MAQLNNHLPCEAYADQPAAEGHEGFTVFQDETSGLYYFAMVDKNGHVVLRSEGYQTPDSRENGIESVVRNRDIEERWAKSKDEEGLTAEAPAKVMHYLSLRAGNHQEIARTCGFDSEGALMGWWLPYAAGAFAWGRSDVEKSIPAAVVAERVAAAPSPMPPVVIPVKKEEVVPPPPPPTAAYREAEPATVAGGSNWWKWLALLALLALLWWWLRG